VPEYDKEKFEAVLKESNSDLFKKKPDLLYHITLNFSPYRAAEKGVTVFRAVQNAGDFIFIFPKAYHSGFSHGFNCGEAVNIIDHHWLKYYREYLDYLAKDGCKKGGCFPLEWALKEIANDIQTFKCNEECLAKVNSFDFETRRS